MEFEFKTLADGKTCFFVLSVPELDLTEYADKDIYSHLEFDLFSYQKVDPRKQGKGWNIAFDYIHKFFATLDNEDKLKLVKFYASAHCEILKYFSSNKLTSIDELSKKLSKYLDILDIGMNLIDKLKNFAVSHISIGVFKEAGKRPQDSSDLTFYPDEIVDLTVISLLCKMFCPIFSYFMKWHHTCKLDNKKKDDHCAAIFTDLFNKKFNPLTNKLKDYIEHVVKQRAQTTISSIMHGINDLTRPYMLYYQLLTHQLVNVDLDHENGNLMTYVLVVIKRAIGTNQNSINKNPACERKQIISKHDDEGNRSQMEIDSMSSSKTYDTLSIVTSAVDHAIETCITSFQLDEELYLKTLHFYNIYPAVPNIISNTLISTFFRKYLGGGKSIDMLKAPDRNKLVALLQVLLVEYDSGYNELAHSLSVVPGTSVSVGVSIDVNEFRLSLNSESYIKCRDRYAQSPFKGKDKNDARLWDSFIDKIIDYIASGGNLYNTATCIWDKIGEDNRNNHIYRPTKQLIYGMCDFYNFLEEIGHNKRVILYRKIT